MKNQRRKYLREKKRVRKKEIIRKQLCSQVTAGRHQIESISSEIINAPFPLMLLYFSPLLFFTENEI